MQILDKIRWKLYGWYYKNRYQPKINFSGTENFEDKVVVYNTKQGVGIYNKQDFAAPNNNGISLVCMSSGPYEALLMQIVGSLHFYEKNYDVTIFDLGLTQQAVDELTQNKHVTVIDYKQQFEDRIKTQKDPSVEVYKLKMELVMGLEKYGQFNYKIYADSACLFLGDLTLLKNFIDKYGFYSGMTQTKTIDWFYHLPQVMAYLQSNFPQVQNPDYYGIEAGFLCFNINHVNSNAFRQKVSYFMQHHSSAFFKNFPQDQGMIATIVNELLQSNAEFSVNLHPNTRVEAIQNGIDTFEKNTLWRKGKQLPLFNYAYHNNSNDKKIPSKRYREKIYDYKTHQTVTTFN